jgi:hypothetical protein
MELLLIVAGLALLGLAAVRFGHDSRELDGAGPWHSWREVSARSRAGAGALALPDPSGLDIEAAFRVDELRLAAARERLLKPAETTAPSIRSPSAHRAAVAWLGAAMVRAGERLQSYGRTAAPGW